MKIYGIRPIALIYNAALYLFGVLAMVVVAWIVSSGNIMITGGAGAVTFIFVIMTFISQLKFKVIVDGDTVEFITKKKSDKYNIDECAFSSRITDKTDISLTVVHGDKSEHYDCSFLGYTKFMELLEDLKVVGENQKAVKLETKIK